MPVDDPFGWITEACHLSSSEESRLRRCSYFGQSDSHNSDSEPDSDSGRQYARDLPTDPIGFTMVTPPDSSLDELRNDQTTVLEDREIFHTPPESRSTSTSFVNCDDDRMVGNGLNRDGETVAVDVDGVDSVNVVNLGKDTDLGLSEVDVDLMQRIEADSNQYGTFPRESEEIRVSKRGFSPKGQLSTESPSKRLKRSNFESPSVSLPIPTIKERDTIELSSSLKENVLSHCENQQNHEFDFEVGEGSVRKATDDTEYGSEERNIITENNYGEGISRGENIHALTKNIECDTEDRNKESENDNGKGSSGGIKNIIEFINKVRSAGRNGSRGTEEKTERKRALPSWADERVGDNESADEEVDVNKRELSSWTNGRLEVDERADRELYVNGRKKVHPGKDSDGSNEDFEEITLLDVLLKLKEDSEDDRHSGLECCSLLEVADRKWGAFTTAGR